MEVEHYERTRSWEPINKKMASAFGKQDGFFAELCVIWHAVENAGQNPLPEIVTEDTARRVATFMREFLRPHLVAFYTGLLDLSDEHDRLKAIAGYILTHKPEIDEQPRGAEGDPVDAEARGARSGVDHGAARSVRVAFPSSAAAPQRAAGVEDQSRQSTFISRSRPKTRPRGGPRTARPSPKTQRRGERRRARGRRQMILAGQKGLIRQVCGFFVLVLGSNLPTIALACANLLYEKGVSLSLSLSLSITPARKRDCRQILRAPDYAQKATKTRIYPPVLAITSCGRVPIRAARFGPNPQASGREPGRCPAAQARAVDGSGLGSDRGRRTNNFLKPVESRCQKRQKCLA